MRELVFTIAQPAAGTAPEAVRGVRVSPAFFSMIVDAVPCSVIGVLPGYGVGVMDVPVYAAAAAILLAVVFVACYLPARHAARLDPAVTLRAGT